MGIGTEGNVLTDCFDTDKVKQKLQNIKQNISSVDSQLQKLIEQNASAGIDEGEYRQKYALLHEERIKLQEKYEKASIKLAESEREIIATRAVIDMLSGKNYMPAGDGTVPSGDGPIPMEFDRMLYRSTVEKIVVNRDDTMEFHMAGGRVFVRSV